MEHQADLTCPTHGVVYRLFRVPTSKEGVFINRVLRRDGSSVEPGGKVTICPECGAALERV